MYVLSNFTSMKLSIGSDHAGFTYKEAIKEMLIANGHDVHDVGTPSPERVDYPDYAYLVAKSVANGETEYGILVCGSGIGVSITANKVAGVRAANCITTEMAQLARAHNNANVVCTGERLVSVELAKEIVTTFLASQFEGGRHTVRVEKIHQLTGC